MNDLIQLLKLTQEELKAALFHYLLTKQYNPVSGDGYLYAEGEIPVLLVAHMDIHPNIKTPTDFYYSGKLGSIYTNDGNEFYSSSKIDRLFSTNGIGGDDRCGVYAIMRIVEEFKPYVIFTEDEELGCVGAKKAVEKMKKPNVKFMIEMDRHGSDDCVFYDCGNKDFQKFIEAFGFKTARGTNSDIAILGSKWNIAATNVSSGYYKEHTSDEYIIFDELLTTIRRIKNILSLDYTKIKPYDFQETKYTYTTAYGREADFDYYLDNYYLYDDTTGRKSFNPNWRAKKNPVIELVCGDAVVTIDPEVGGQNQTEDVSTPIIASEVDPQTQGGIKKSLFRKDKKE